MGMSLLRKLEFPDAQFDLYFLAYRGAFAGEAEGVEEGEAGVSAREGVLELTYNCLPPPPPLSTHTHT